MEQIYRDSIAISYHHGSHIRLSSDWHDKNVICPNSKIYYVLDGELCVEIENQKYTVRPGDAILIPAGTKHSYHLGELPYAEKYWFHFDLRSAQVNYFDLVDFPYLKHIGKSQKLDALFSSVVNSNGDKPSDKIALASAISAIVAIFLDGDDYYETALPENDEVDKVIAFIKKNYFENFTLPSLAKMAKLSPNHFSKKFKEKVGYPPLKYVNILRLERAKFLLEHTEKPINTVMEEVGFWDSAHFSKLFKAETGYSPSKFRRVLASRKKNV